MIDGRQSGIGTVFRPHHSTFRSPGWRLSRSRLPSSCVCLVP